MNEKVVRIVIDHREYLFKLSTKDEIDRLHKLATQLEKRIQFNKRNIATTDYTKVLILTCLDLLEEINQSQKAGKPSMDSDSLKKLMEIHAFFHSHDHS